MLGEVGIVGEELAESEFEFELFDFPRDESDEIVRGEFSCIIIVN